MVESLSTITSSSAPLWHSSMLTSKMSVLVTSGQSGSPLTRTVKQTLYDHVYRYLITFADRETADEWWRMVSTHPSPYVGNVRRIAPQFYIQGADKINVANTFFTQPALPDAKQFFERMFFTLLNDRDARVLSTVPPIHVTDHISGRWYVW